MYKMFCHILYVNIIEFSIKGNCNFELDLCSWSNVHGSGDNFDWVKGSGRTTSSGTGPSTDHTTNNSTGKTNIIIDGYSYAFFFVFTITFNDIFQ